MDILRYIKRQYNNLLFRLMNDGVRIEGKGLQKGTKCTNNGMGNVIYIDAGASLTNCRLFFNGNNNRIHISCGTHLSRVSFWFEDDCNLIDVGKMVTCESGVDFSVCEGKTIMIGDDCMFSNNIKFRTTDSHSILNHEGKRINKAEDIIIGNHVWLGVDVLVLKGVKLSDNCIVGARSVVTSSLKVEPGNLIAGTPAKVIKNNISWKRERV